MKCPNCGKEIEEGHLICEVCGSEIQMVPDFEPEIENSITETLSTLAALQDEGQDESIQQEMQDMEEDEEVDEAEEKENKRRKLGIMISTVIVFLIILSTYVLYLHHVNTVSYQIDKAKECAAQGSYEQAITYLDTAYEKDDSLAQILFMKADYYYLMSDNESALQALKQIIDKGEYPYEDVEEAYDKMITIYSNEGRYEEINTLLLACKEDTIVNMFQSYMAKEPEFSYVEGDYAEIIPLKLSSNTSGTIYYTMDGTTPNKNSDVYTAPLFLESGDYTISAFFVNDYGIESEIVKKSYHINLEVPNAPEIAVYSGEYHEPMVISVQGQEGCEIYYTTDGSEPTKDSVPYTGPIPMPLGNTHFKFVNISEEGVSSEVTMRTYRLTLENTISTDEAVARLIAGLVESGYLQDASGKVENQNITYHYEFSSVISIGEESFFTINEYYDDGTGVLNRTDKVFVVQVYTGEVARLGFDEKGTYIAVPLGPY
ncbi:MAG: chitobiase/beta-hexosaminidase C-terminal domain-containing protein [Lachnospiraceae bacterium]|nr:chitobiase/beta-hexosaminidase C-terminal domain-containing protein [Lachnospiraceae bacterium]